MKRHTKNIAAVALLALAGGAFLVDRFVIGYTPATASAAVDTPATTVAAERAAAPAPAAATPSSRVAERLSRLAQVVGEGDGTQSKDAFVIPAVWRTTIAAPAKPASNGAAPMPASTQVETAKAPAAHLELTGVIVGSNPAATINGRIVKVGRKIAGYTLLSVAADKRKPATAVLSGPAGELILQTKMDDNVRTDVVLEDEASADDAHGH